MQGFLTQSADIDYDAHVARFEDDYFDNFCECFCPDAYSYHWRRQQRNSGARIKEVADFEVLLPSFSETVQTLINGVRLNENENGGKAEASASTV